MIKKLFLIILSLNLILFAWQSALSISLSTQGDVLTERLLIIEEIQNQIDVLDNKLAQVGNLEKISILASSKGFVPAKMVRYSVDNLADARLR